MAEAHETSRPGEAAEVEALVRKAAAGDGAAVERLLLIYHPRLLGFARRKIGVDWQSKIDPDDVLQEAYVDIFAKIGEFEVRGEDAFYHWATRIIDHRFIDHVRRLRRKKRDVAREVAAGGGRSSARLTLLERCMPETMTPSRIMRREDAVSAMMCCIAQLPEHYRAVVERVYLNEEPIGQVAADLDRSEDAVRRMVGRAVEQLRQGLGRASKYISRDR